MSNDIPNYGNSSFWMSNPDDSLVRSGMSKKQESAYDLYKLVQQRRAISNFVSILTKQSIPVKFNVSGDSYTDGKQIVISSSLSDPKDFDVACGLALHEASHIVLSDFELLRNLKTELLDKSVYYNQLQKSEERGIPYLSTIKSILNYVEDRRIDRYVYDQAPGYRPYYHSMYDKYFNDSVIEKALQTNEFTDENVNSYMFRIINLHSKNSRLGALKGLKSIYSIIDFHNIERLKNSSDALDVAIKVYDVMLEHIEIPNQSDESDEGDSSEMSDESSDSNSGEGQSTEVVEVVTYDTESDNDDSESDDQENEDGEKSDETDEEGTNSKGSSDKSDEETDDESNGDSSDGESDEDEESDETDGGSSKGDSSDEGDEEEENEGGSSSTADSDKKSEEENESSGDNEDNSDEETDSDESESDGESKEPDVELTDRQKKIIQKKIDKQRNFVDGEVRKTQITKSESRQIDVISETDSEIVSVGEDVDTWNPQGVKCIVVKNMTRAYCESSDFPFTSNYWSTSNKRNDEYVTRGIRLGNILAKKLQVHGESRTTHFNRQKTGKLDKRLIASLGFGNESVFYRSETDRFNDVNLHISIDASGSMGGAKWEKTMVNTVSLIRACDMIENINIQVTFRATVEVSSKYTLPIIMVAYDSRTDSFQKVRNLFQFIHPTGTTPEGLCFEAIEKLIVESSNNLDSYFLNISDGMPQFQNREITYYGRDAETHTYKQVNRMRKRGVNVLSYFIGNSSVKTHAGFDRSYGSSAKYIEVTNMNQVSQTMNKLFLQK